MLPAPGERLLRFVGDKALFTLRAEAQPGAQKNWQARLRTNLGRAAARRREIIAAHAGGAAAAGASWRDVPMQPIVGGWQVELPLAEVGYFKTKPYLLDEKNWQHWPDGSDIGISVHPNFARTANTIYCAFTRLFGAAKTLASAADAKLETQLKSLEARGYATLPPSGKFRDLTRQLPFIVNRLGCRILHLLPVHPTPATYARFGRMGSPYAALDLTAVDPALVEFDRRTTGIDQFCELTQAAHSFGARVFIDIVINHTGWGSVLQENHPEFFLKKPDGEFASPGAWGTVWEDLVELEQDDVRLWDLIADALLVWGRRGVDGFRCDAGYKIPTPAWQYIIARVQEEFPETIFLLEGLGGSWQATEDLLTDGGMQWAYSELFQNYSGREIADYLDYANRQSARVGSYIHYSETHDNDRLAKKGRAWSLLRNRLCALASPSGGFGFTCGVEWLAEEKIRVHDVTGLNWDSPGNITSELEQLNRLISDHPCFFDGAQLTRLSEPDSPVYALLRESAEGQDTALILTNTDVEAAHALTLEAAAFRLPFSAFQFDLLGQPLPKSSAGKDPDKIVLTLPPGAVFCLAPTAKPAGLSGENYRRARAQAAFGIEALSRLLPIETADGLDWRWLAEQVNRSPADFLATASEFAARRDQTSFSEFSSATDCPAIFPRVVSWSLIDARRVTLVPPGHWLLVEDTTPFRATLQTQNAGELPACRRSIPAGDKHVACFAPRETAAEAGLTVERYSADSRKLSASIRHLAAAPGESPINPAALPAPEAIVLLTNGRGGMARLCVDLGRVNSKYDCVLGANLDPQVPVDRHVFVKRLRVWVNADGFLSPLNYSNLVAFQSGPTPVWQFIANAGDGRTVEIELRAQMVADKNTVAFRFTRPSEQLARGKQLPAKAEVKLTVRVDIEDRNFHCETRRDAGADAFFSSHTQPLQPQTGFAFTPASDRQLRVFSDGGIFHPQPEWCENIPHPVEQSRGQAGSGDAYSPGWFELPLAKGADATLVATAEINSTLEFQKYGKRQTAIGSSESSFGDKLSGAAKQFVVRRDDFKTVIAGYPWFLDWGRDSLICARGLLAAGLKDEVRQILLTFAKFEKDGTLPNTINGGNVSNRDTTDAPLWLALACEDLGDEKFYQTAVDESGRTIRDVLASIAANYVKGTPNGIRMDADSGLIWSPSHFTWMDTNYPAGTPREGYPVEIQALWIRLLRQLATISRPADQSKWRGLADCAAQSLEKLFWLEPQGWLADVLVAGPQVSARNAVARDTLRGNCLFAVSLGLLGGERARRCVEAARKYLLVPGALRSLAPLPVTIPLPVKRDGQLLNDPTEPYWPRYEGDEDTRRKPAYHNGTAWGWTLPTFCEALAQAWEFSPAAVAAAKSYLGSAEQLFNSGCLEQLPEILDGDAPHAQRGCDAQAWSVTETLRVWKQLSKPHG